MLLGNIQHQRSAATGIWKLIVQTLCLTKNGFRYHRRVICYCLNRLRKFSSQILNQVLEAKRCKAETASVRLDSLYTSINIVRSFSIGKNMFIPC